MEAPIPPCHGQTADQVEAWLRANVKVGAAVAVRNTQGGLLHYLPGKVVRLGRGRFEVELAKSYGLGTGGNSFYYSGKNCRHPRGQTRLVVPTDEVIGAFGPPRGMTYGPYSV